MYESNVGLGIDAFESHESSFRVPWAWISPLLALFTIGGLIFGLVFLRNLNSLLTRSGITTTITVQSVIPQSMRRQAAATAITAITLVPNRVDPRVEAAVASGDSAPPAVEATVVEAPAVPAPADPTEPLPAWDGHQRVNILLLGIDRRNDEDANGTRSDTMMVVSVDPVDHSATMVSLPRDLWVSIPGYGDQRLNVAHAVGGPELAARTIEANFGLHIDHWARIDFTGFEKIVDTLGGVLVDVERPIKDDEYPTDDYGLRRLYIGPGPQLMDGKTALMFARSRHSENDFGRAHRQQQVLLAMRDRALALNVLPKLPTLIGEAKSTVITDLSVPQMLGLGRLASDLDSTRVSSIVFDTRYADPFVGEGGSQLLMPNRPAIQRALARVNAGLEPEPARIEVLNGSTVEGLAARTAETLAKWGFEIVRVAPADRTDYSGAEIAVLGNRRNSGLRLGRALGIPDELVRDQAGQGSNADLRLTVGNGFELPAGQ